MKQSATSAIHDNCRQDTGERTRFAPMAYGLPLLILALLSLLQTPAKAEVRLVTANPAEDASTQMNIGWHADLDQANCQVIYTEVTDEDWAQATTIPGTSRRSDVFDGIDSKKADGTDWKEEAKFLDYGVTLTELKPDTDYMYKVLCGEESTEKTVRYFKTAGAGEFSFLWISDAHGYLPLPGRLRSLNSVVEAALAIEPSVDFVFSTGDVVAWGGSYSFWVDFFELPFAANYMFANVIGNHDWMKRRDGGDSEFFAVAHHNPANGYAGQEGVSYWFIYGDVLFIILNNEAMKTGPEALAEAQAWAADVIEKQKGNYTRIFLAEHYQWFDGRNGRSSWYDKWKEFCDQHNVTLAMAGNNHIYKRTHPLRGDQVVADGLGTVYMEAPSSDGERGVKAGPLTTNAEKLAFTYSSQLHTSETSVKTIGCVLVDVGPDSIRTRLVYLDDEMKVQIADEHTISTKPAHAPAPDSDSPGDQPAGSTARPDAL